MALTAYYTLISQLAQDSAGRLTPNDMDRALGLAVARYSKDRPRKVVEDVVSVLGGSFLDLPEAWESGFSVLQQVEYPVGQVPVVVIPPVEGWELMPVPDGEIVALLDAVPANATLRLSYTVRHVVSADTDTIPEHDSEAVCCWAAAVLCEQLAAWYAANGDPTIAADRVDQTSPQKAYAAQAKTLRQRYFAELGVEDRRHVAAGTVVSHTDRNSLGGPRMTHPLRGFTGQR